MRKKKLLSIRRFLEVIEVLFTILWLILSLWILFQDL
jgi:hypothetical protein